MPSEENSSQSQEQPGQETNDNNSEENLSPNIPGEHRSNTIRIDTPVPENDADDQLVASHLLCCDDEVLMVDPLEEPWRVELEVPTKHHSGDLETSHSRRSAAGDIRKETAH